MRNAQHNAPMFEALCVVAEQVPSLLMAATIEFFFWLERRARVLDGGWNPSMRQAT